MKRDIIIIGGGEHSSVIVSAIVSDNNANWNLIGIIDKKQSELDIPWLGTDNTLPDIFEKYADAKFIIGIGNSETRKKIINEYKIISKKFISVIHPTALIAYRTKIEAGVFINVNTIIQPGTKICKHVIINTGAIVEHDCTIGENTHIAPGVVMGGGCSIGSNCLIGIGSTIRDHIRIGDNVTVGAGAVVVNDIEDNQTVVGNPAKSIK
jgi:sugar O-acyltransferase (sialic acid O-acetyltransferase NeuD family)